MPDPTATVTVTAPAKLTLSLRITGVRDDGYHLIDAVMVALDLADELAIGAGAQFLLVLDTGEMQQPEEYGAATVTGIGLDGGVSYLVAPKIVVSAGAQLATFGFAFKGTGTLSDPDGDGTADIPGGRDTYYGGAVKASYLF